LSGDVSSAGAGARDAAAVCEARRLLARAERVVVLTGAGLSADSGLRTFRDPDGHWRQHRPQELATPQAFARDPCLVWSWYGARRDAVGQATPNAAHRAMARFADRHGGVTIVTQNVDSLHTVAAREVIAERAAGEDSGAFPLELHGCLFRTRCTGCGRRHEDRDAVDATSPERLPRCAACGALLRPDVVWFGESLGKPIERAFELAASAQACLVVGTSAVVQPAASVALMTRRAGGAIIEVNPEETPLTELAVVSLRATAVEVVPELLRAES
jgi:NAD-dependent deacetylase